MAFEWLVKSADLLWWAEWVVELVSFLWRLAWSLHLEQEAFVDHVIDRLLLCSVWHIEVLRRWHLL
jgi:hypothetical protein